MLVLGIETSCDETGLALYDTDAGLIAEVLYSQIPLHQQYGGVVPELASRDHVRKLLPLLEQLLQQANKAKTDIEAIAYTKGPGLMGALLTGAMFARTLAYALNIPAIGVHHMEGHLLAPAIGASPPPMPSVVLLVSGGHTQLLHVAAFGQYQLLGESVDDAAGEAFDKVAKMLGLPYPGGPHVAKLALQGNTTAFALPRPMLHQGLDFSFSGLKTAVQKLTSNPANSKADIAASFEQAVVDVLCHKCVKALKQTHCTTLVVAGGVSANVNLRAGLAKALAAIKATAYYAPPALCTDNGTMIAYAGAQRLLRGEREPLAVELLPRWPLTDLTNLPTAQTELS